MTATALIADDEPLLREVLRRGLADAWPALQIVGEARHGLEALEMAAAHRPRIAFLDVHMPGMSGIEVAQRLGRDCHCVFVTAFDQYALKAFETGALDYLVKPVQAPRLAETVARLQQRLALEQPVRHTEALLQQLAQQLAPAAQPYQRWIKAQVGASVRLIPVDDIDYLKSDEKYTLVAWRDGAQPMEALIRTPIKELAAQLDPAQFQQVHRAVVVNLQAIRQVVRGDNETAEIQLKTRPEKLPVSRSFLGLFKPE
jgi:DNA-binding LytR/AlgR family response regulator